MQPTEPCRTPLAAMTNEQRAWLTWQAMDHSDDIVLLLERASSEHRQAVTVIGGNDAFHRATGYDEVQIAGQPIAALFPDKEQVETLTDTIHRDGSARAEMALLRADGSTFVLGLHVMPVPASESFATGTCFVVLGRDITGVLEARNVQLATQKLLAKVFISIQEAVIIVDTGDRIVMTNPYADQLLGYKPNALAGRPSLDIVALRDRDLIALNRKQQMAEGGDLNFDVLLLLADGSEQTMRVRSVLVERDDHKKFRLLTLRPIAASATHTTNAGHIKLVGLNEVRNALGGRWSALATRAMATAEAVIKRRCGKEDSYSQADDSSFLICFGALDANEATFRAAMIGREIRDRLIGQCDDPATAQVRAIAASVTLPWPEEQSIPVRNATLLAGLDGQLQQIERDARATLKAAVLDASCELEPVQSRPAGEVVATWVCLSDALERKLLCACAALPRDETEAFDLDGLLLGLAARRAVAVLARGASHTLLVPVGFDMFSSRPATDRFIELCRQLDKRLTKQLVFMLSGLPDGLTRSRLFDCVNRLRPFCCGVGFQADDPALLAPLDLAPSGHAVVALSAEAVATMSFDKMKVLVGFLHARRMKLLVRRLGSADQAAKVLARGADLISLTRGAL
ncbi:MAG: PAS domain-containing protein [Acetobacteraceae bacterium]|jgi:PAS domain S-box-containing protein